MFSAKANHGAPYNITCPVQYIHRDMTVSEGDTSSKLDTTRREKREIEISKDQICKFRERWREETEAVQQKDHRR